MNHDSALARPNWALDPAAVVDRCVAFIRETIARTGHTGVVVGLSGGIDSAVAAALAVRALGAERVHSFCLPHADSDSASLRDAQAVADQLGLVPDIVPITPMVAAFLQARPDADAVRRGNIMARVRMIVLFDASQARRALVLGTGNRSEWLLGYTTMHGDAACGLNPIGQLYKTEIRLVAAHLGLPRQVLAKAPSADLWSGQADEDELGFTYRDADRALHHLVDEDLQPRQMASLGLPPALVDRVAARLWSQAFKRNLPPVCDFGRPHPDAV
ncbi:MAG: NAD+ synthase [Candidatus Krumholzibacteria bacterium]|jgi:NAD+ synthase|nr:NAD+ synthase [Candidatus Krumholzibacteria bacterium]